MEKQGVDFSYMTKRKFSLRKNILARAAGAKTPAARRLHLQLCYFWREAAHLPYFSMLASQAALSAPRVST